ncbi:MAG: cache domain-containing protein [Candidatus Omnitrophica bacterium]|nr:cache domain-containing protein [Candidatus Omnitrophota bacterium]
MTIRFRLTVWMIGIILAANSILALITALHVGNVLIDEVQTRVRLDLNSARRVYNDYLEAVERNLRSFYVQQAVETQDLAQLHQNLNEVYDALEIPLDVLSFVGTDGAVIYRAHNPDVRGDNVLNNPIIAGALKHAETMSGTIIVSQDELARENRQLAQQAFMKIQDTPAALPIQKAVELNGMMIAAAAPVRNRQGNGEVKGVLYGAILLNRRYDIVDSIRDEVFQSHTHDGKDVGMATIFQSDLRISTNVPTKDGKRAIGTRLSSEVYEQVLNKGEIWAKRAFVVNDWYITAYGPIRDPSGQIIGALYVGVLEKPYLQIRNLIVVFFLVTVAVITLISLFVLGLATKQILKPIGPIIRMAHQVIDGDLSARVKEKPTGEMGDLCKVINQMADAVRQREEQLKQTTRQQIGQSEKLASIGRLAAGIAHEINNPLTGVLTFAHLLRQNENFSSQDRQDLDVIIQETTRVREIVRGLLDFARESPSMREPLNFNDVIEQTLKLVRSQKEFREVQIQQNLDPSIPPVKADKNQLQQVLLNLCLNACEAMQNGGDLTITTQSHQDGYVAVLISDTGCGIAAEDQEKIFDPFYTTKPVGKGTGLGLSVSYGIIQSHGGDIDVESRIGEGTTFKIVLPQSE